MNSAVVGIFSLVCGVAGWFYLFYSNAAAKLALIEPTFRNRVRVGLYFCLGGLVLLGTTLWMIGGRRGCILLFGWG